MNSIANPLHMSLEARHKETLAMLAEAMDFLSRMPRVPVTVDMVKKMQDHLDLPSNRMIENMNDMWAGARASPAGEVYARAEMIRGELVVVAPGSTERDPERKAERDAKILEMFRKGMWISLRNEGARDNELTFDE